MKQWHGKGNSSRKPNFTGEAKNCFILLNYKSLLTKISILDLCMDI